MSGNGPLKEALAALRAALKKRGFASKGTTFHRAIDAGNLLLLTVQKSRTPPPDAARITFNSGVYSARLGARLQRDPSTAFDVTRAHRTTRSTKDGREQWLEVRNTDPVVDVVARMMDAVEPLLADLDHHSSDEALRDAWLGGSGGGLTEMQRLLYLVILVSDIGPGEILPGALAALRTLVEGRPQEPIVKHELDAAGIPSW